MRPPSGSIRALRSSSGPIVIGGASDHGRRWRFRTQGGPGRLGLGVPRDERLAEVATAALGRATRRRRPQINSGAVGDGCDVRLVDRLWETLVAPRS